MYRGPVSTSSEAERRSKKNKKGPLKAAWRVFEEYSDSSTIHGTKYLGERDRHWIERAFWIVAFFSSAFGCSIMIYKIYDKWQTTPVIVSFAEKSTPVWEVPFPAVTICPETKVRRDYLDFTKAYDLVKKNHVDRISAEELKRFEAIAQTCELHLLQDENLNSELEREEIVPMMKSSFLSLDETTLRCRWRFSHKLCSELFAEVLTEEGTCYTFNALDNSELFRGENLSADFDFPDHNISSTSWSLEKGYQTKNISTYPHRVLGSGSRAGLSVLLMLNEIDLDYICRGPVQGFKIILHTPGELPRVSKHFIRVPLRQEIVISVIPNMITTDDNLVDYAPNKRQCFFEKERYLKFFRSYTQTNCETECLANHTLSKCGCVKFSLPRNDDTKVCTLSESTCYNAAEDDLMLRELTQSLASKNERQQRGKSFCNCLPSCTSIIYDAETSQADFEFRKLFDALGFPSKSIEEIILSKVTILFKESQITTSKRSELYGFIDFVANCGGLLGLFMGFSLLSLVEIIYHVTLRLAVNLNERAQQKMLARRRSFDVNEMKDFDKTGQNLIAE